MSKNLSRRDFLKLTLTSFGATFLTPADAPSASPRDPIPHHHADRGKHALEITAIYRFSSSNK